MARRAETSGISLSQADAAIVKGMLAKGDRQHDVAAWFGVNDGRIAEIANGHKFPRIAASPFEALPPRGPYLAGRDAAIVEEALTQARRALERAEELLRRRRR